MKKNIGVRFNETQLADLEEIAKKNGMDAAVLIRMAVDALIALYRQNGGKIILPLDFSGRYEITDRAATPAPTPPAPARHEVKTTALNLPQRVGETPAPTPSTLKPTNTRKILPSGR